MTAEVLAMPNAGELKIARNLALPIDVAGQTIGLVGIRGSGKTNTGGVIAEELLDRNQRIVVIDPTDAWWGLRSGYPVYIFGGPHGDVPLAETDGKVLAEFVVTEQVPLILSLRHLRKNAQRRFVTEFCEELYHLKGRDLMLQPGGRTGEQWVITSKGRPLTNEYFGEPDGSRKYWADRKGRRRWA